MNLAHLIDDHPADQVAIISRSRATTYGVLRDQVSHLRGGLVGLGVGAGDRVGIVCSNGRFFVDTYLAVLGLGAVAVPLNPIGAAPEIQRELAAVEASVVVVDAVGSATWRSVDLSKLPSLRAVVSTEGDIPGAVAFADLLLAEPAPIVDVEPDTLAALMFTSGTAGAPHAAMLSHGNLLANLEQSRSSGNGIVPADVVYGVLPMFHIFGLNVVLGQTLLNGATVVLVQRFDPSTALDTIRDRRVTVVPGAPPMWVAFSAFDSAPTDSFATVRLALTGAAAMPEEAMRRVEERFGLVLREGYGLTEAAPVVTSSAGIEARYGSVGKVLSGMEVRLVDESGDDVAVGEAGEVCVRGPNVFQGYWREPELSAKVVTADGWLRTGDIATVDADGYLYITDRAKDLIIVNGFNVFPAEVEEVLREHPAVAEVGVVGVAHPLTGEAVKAFVVLQPGADLDEEQLITWCGDYLARYKCPNKVLFVEQLPRNVSGKLLRRELV